MPSHQIIDGAFPLGFVDLPRLRSDLLNELLLWVGLGLLVSQSLAIWRELLLDDLWSLPVRLLTTCGLWGLWFLRHRLPYRLRAALFLGSLWLLVAFSILNLGPVASSKGLLVLLTPLTMLLLSPRLGWFSVALVALLIGSTGVAAVSGVLAFPLDYAAHVRTPAVWVQSTFGLTFYSTIAALMMVRLVHSLEGAARRLATQVRDLHRVYRQLQRTLQRQRSVYDSSAVGIGVVDAGGRLRDLNARGCALLGARRRDLIGLPVTDLLCDGWPGDWRRLHRVLASRGQLRLEARLRLRPDGGRWCELHLTPLDPRHPARGITLVLVDIDRRRRAEQAAASARAAAETANQDKDRLLAGVSHDLRAPLHALLGLAETLARTDLPADAAGLLAGIRRNGADLRRRIEDLLEISRARRGGLSVRPRPCASRPLLAHCIAQVRASAQAKGLMLELRIAPDLPDAVWLDPERLHQILVNLLDNAIKFTVRGRVRLCARARISGRVARLRFSVTDTGPGIAAAQTRRIFEPFVQLPQGGDGAGRRPRGLGLGLAISAELVRAMGGQLGVRSRPGRASSFWLCLSVPVLKARPAVAPRRTSGGAPPPPAGPRPPVGALPAALVIALWEDLLPRWRALDAADAAARDAFAATLHCLALAHDSAPLAAWARSLTQARGAAAAGLLGGFPDLLPTPPPAAALARLREWAALGLVSRIADWCAGQLTGAGPTAAFAGLVLTLAQDFETAALARLLAAAATAGSPDDDAGDPGA